MAWARRKSAHSERESAQLLFLTESSFLKPGVKKKRAMRRSSLVGERESVTKSS